MKDGDKLLLAAAGVLALGALGMYAWKQGGGLLSGDNALTRNATDASGNPVTAYQGAGVVGSLGAAANAASGGYFASAGDWVGGRLFDLFGPSVPDITAPTGGANSDQSAAESARLARYNQIGNTDSSGALAGDAWADYFDGQTGLYF